MPQTVETVPGGQIITTWDSTTRTVQLVPDANTPTAIAQTIEARGAANITRLTAIVNAATWTAAQRDTAIKDIAKATRDLTRLALGLVDQAD